MSGGNDARNAASATETSAAEDAALAQVLDETLRAVESGKPVDSQGLLAAHPALASRLRVCLAGMGLIEREARELAPPKSNPAFESETPILPQFSDYHVLREVGRGGMGIVYEAEQISLKRRVALKVLPFAATLDPRHMQRFKNEAHAAAHLHHTNIVPVHAVGCERGVHFYVMQFIDGQNLDTVLRAMRPERDGAPNPEAGTAARVSTLRSTSGAEYYRTIARLGVQTAEALDHAHQQGVVHRDIKPANLLLDAGGHLWITDFGLAQIQGDHRLTQTGTRVGTLRYMSPEQAMARRGEVDHRTDIYALGATLYELLTMRPLFDGCDPQELLRHIALDDPIPPRQLERAIPVELEIIVLKALAKEPHERYASAQEMADDLRRFLEDRPIHARRPSVMERVTKWARRHRSIVRTATASLILAVFVLACSTLLIYHAKEEAEGALIGEKKARGVLEFQTKKLQDALDRETDARNALEIEQKKLLKERENTRAALKLEKEASYRHSIARADQEWWEGRSAVSAQLLDNCPEELCNWEHRYLRRLHATALQKIPERKHSFYWRHAVTPDGAKLAAASMDGFIYVWDVATGRELHKLAAPEPRAYSLAFSADGRRLAAAGGVFLFNFKQPDAPTSVKVWDATSGDLLYAMDGQCPTIYDVAFSADGRLLAMACSNGMVRVADAAKGKEIHALAAHKGSVYALTISADGKRLVSAGSDRAIRHWDLTTGLIAKDVPAPGFGYNNLAFGRDGQLLAYVANDRTIRILNPFSGLEFRKLQGHTGNVYRIAFSEDGKLLASSSVDQTARLWDVASGQEQRAYRGHENAVSEALFADKGRRLITLSNDKFLRVWDTGAHQFVKVLEGHGGADVSALCFSPDSRVLASGGFDRTIRLWDVSGHKRLHVLTGHTFRIENIAFHPDGKRLASVSSDKTLRIWNLTTGKESSRFEHAGGKEWALAFRPDGKFLISATSPGLRHIELDDDKAAPKLTPIETAHRLVLSSDSRYMAALGLEGPTTLWDIARGKKLLTFGTWPRARLGAFSPDGKLFASSHSPEDFPIDSDWRVHIFETATGDKVASLRDKQSGFVHLAFSPDNSRLATSDRDGARLWEVRTGHELLRLRGVSGPVRHLTFSPDGRYLAGFDGKNILVWDAGG